MAAFYQIDRPSVRWYTEMNMPKEISQYFNRLIKTFSSFSFYTQLPKTTVRTSLVFFLISMLWLGGLRSWRWHQFELPRWRSALDQTATEIKQEWPTNLEIKWDGQKLTVNQDSPLAVPMPEATKQPEMKWEGKLAYIVGQDNAPTQLAAVLPSSSLVIITPTQLHVSDGQGAWTSTTLSTLPVLDQTTFSLSQQNVPAVVDHLTDQAQKLTNKIVDLIIVGWPVALIINRILVVGFDTILLYIVLRLLSKDWKLKQLWPVALHAAVAAELVNFVGQFLYPHSTLPWFSLVFWLITGATVFKLSYNKKVR